MNHDERCDHANPNNKCNCHCGGARHGSAYEQRQHDQFSRSLNPNLGGEIAEMMLKLQDAPRPECNCGKRGCEIVTDEPMGYPHDGGLADSQGRKWWLWYPSTKCGYQWSWGKVEHRIARAGVPE